MNTLDNRYDRFSGCVSSDFDGSIFIQWALDSKTLVELPLNTTRKDVFTKGLASKERCGFSYPWAEIGKYRQSFKAWVKGSNLLFVDIIVN